MILAKDLYLEMTKLRYGWQDNVGNIHTDNLDGFYEKFIVSSNEFVLDNMVGTCIEQSNLAYEVFSKNEIKVNIYFLKGLEDEKVVLHCFVVYKDDKFNYFESAMQGKRGIYSFDNLDDLFKKVVLNLNSHYKMDSYKIYDVGLADTNVNIDYIYNMLDNSKPIFTNEDQKYCKIN